MNYHNAYVPKRKKVNYKIVVPFIIVIAVLIVAGFQYLKPKEIKVTNELLNVCGLNPKRTQSLILNQEVEHTRTFQDYGLYGQTLGIYEEDYQVSVNDTLLGKTIYIRNICNDDEYSFLMGTQLDNKIPIEQLNEGIYVVEVLQGLDRERFVSPEAIQENFTALSSHGEAKQIAFIADKHAFELDGNGTLEDNYLFLNVTTVEVEDEHYDMVLDPGGLTTFENGKTNMGAARKDLVEAVETYNLALGVQSILEEKGLKVKVIRDNASPINQFGPGSRASLAYETEAKYYIQFNLQFSFYKPDKGMTILYSNFATNSLATSIMESLNQASDLPTSNFTSKNNIKGVYKTKPVNGYDGRAVIRELGAQFTGAGRVDEFATIHEPYKDHKKGMQVVSIDYGFINDDATYDAWINQNQAIIEATAAGILKGLGID